MPKEYVNPNTLFPSAQHGFFQLVGASGQRIVFISGQTAWDIRKKIVGGDSLLEQARQALRNVQAAIEVTGGTFFFGKSAGQYLDRRVSIGRSRISDRD